MTEREIGMSLSAEDVEFLAESERLSFVGVSEGLSFLVTGSGIIDPYTQNFTPALPTWVLASGTLSTIQEGDAILGMSGKLSIGDFVAMFYYPDVVQLIDCSEIRREATHQVFTVVASVRAGLAPPFSRLELGLCLKPNE